jgi:hypothetical protein
MLMVAGRLLPFPLRLIATDRDISQLVVPPGVDASHADVTGLSGSVCYPSIRSGHLDKTPGRESQRAPLSPLPSRERADAEGGRVRGLFTEFR